MTDYFAEIRRRLDAINDVAVRAAERTKALEQLRAFQADQKERRRADAQDLHDRQHLSFAEIAEKVGLLTRGRWKQIYDGDSSNADQRRRRESKEAAEPDERKAPS